MPQIKVRGISVEDLCKISTGLIDNLTEIIKCPRDYFEIECIHSTAIKDGQIAPVYPFIEVAWFDRGQQIQDQVAKEITRQIQSLGINDVDLAFSVFQKERYYENGEHF